MSREEVARRRSEASMNRRNYLQLAAGATVVSLAGCAGGDGADGGDGDDGSDGSDGGDGGDGGSDGLSTLSIAVNRTGSSSPLWYELTNQEFDAQNGVNLDMRWLSVPAAQDQVRNQQVETGFMSALDVARSRAGGVDMHCLWPMYTNVSRVITRADAEVSTESTKATLEDLQNLTIGSLGQESTMYSTLSVLASENGMDMDDFDIRTGPPPVITGLLQDGQLDGMVNVEPSLSALVSSGDFKEVLDLSPAWERLTGHQLPITAIVASSDTIEQKPEALRSFMDAFFAASGHVNENLASLNEKYSSELGVQGAEREALTQRIQSVDNWFADGFKETLRNGHVEMVERAYEHGLLENEPDVDDMFIDPRSEL